MAKKAGAPKKRFKEIKRLGRREAKEVRRIDAKERRAKTRKYF